MVCLQFVEDQLPGFRQKKRYVTLNGNLAFQDHGRANPAGFNYRHNRASQYLALASTQFGRLFVLIKDYYIRNLLGRGSSAPMQKHICTRIRETRRAAPQKPERGHVRVRSTELTGIERSIPGALHVAARRSPEARPTWPREASNLRNCGIGYRKRSRSQPAMQEGTQGSDCEDRGPSLLLGGHIVRTRTCKLGFDGGNRYRGSKYVTTVTENLTIRVGSLMLPGHRAQFGVNRYGDKRTYVVPDSPPVSTAITTPGFFNQGDKVRKEH
ncbi:hypothetical protein DFP72DRAFT_847191 [Ephemerocybe angulata]|uniref:Uncharacterized protein n=1 Tax=Ephemerocybe angulata TaxID=980116 RepID=A0A8H6HZQ6_9AGAR|nr:hypothetical protein DFP72DRAFT_847191 [Tulosesus angulatus]